jgi:hypothetical protein
MGTWGAGAYENDMALDWASETGASLEGIEAALDEVNQTSESDYLDADVGSVGVAACEALYGYHNPKPGLLDKLKGVFGCKQKSVAKQPNLIVKAHRALDRITGANSELMELWAESKDQGKEWQDSMSGLRQRLKSILE